MCYRLATPESSEAILKAVRLESEAGPRSQLRGPHIISCESPSILRSLPRTDNSPFQRLDLLARRRRRFPADGKMKKEGFLFTFILLLLSHSEQCQ